MTSPSSVTRPQPAPPTLDERLPRRRVRGYGDRVVQGVGLRHFLILDCGHEPLVDEVDEYATSMGDIPKMAECWMCGDEEA